MLGLSFLNSFFLWGLLAAAIPVIIHLIKKNRAVKVPFAAMRFLMKETDEKFKSQRLKQFLLLLMRIAALAILAVAFARPFFKGDVKAGFLSGQPRAVVILIDNSFSMASKNNFQTAVASAKELLATFQPGDQVTVLQFAEKSKVIVQGESDFRRLAAQLDQKLTLSNEGTDYLLGLQSAESLLLESDLPEKQIYMISDFQESAWEKMNPLWKIHSAIKVDLLPVGSREFKNIAVQDLQIQKTKPGRKAHFLTKVRNYSDEAAKVQIALRTGNRIKARQTAQIAGNQESIVQFKNILLPRGLAYGDIELTDSADDLELDDRYYFVLQDEKAFQVLAVNGEPFADNARDELFYFERAVNLPRVARYSLVEATPKTLDTFELGNFRAVVLANVKELSREHVDLLTYYVRNGGGLIIALGDQVNPNIFNTLFQSLSPAKINNRAFKRLDRSISVILTEIDYQHPIFRQFAGPGQGDPSSAQFYQYFHVSPRSEEAVLSHYDDGSPAIIEHHEGAGKVILWTSSLDAEWNDLPVKAMYLPLLYQTLDYVASQKKGQKSYLIGHSVAMLEYKNRSRNLPVAVETPSGDIDSQNGDYFDGTTSAGIYRVQRKRASEAIGYFAVNVDNNESDLRPLPPEALQNKIAQITDNEIRTSSLVPATFDTQREQSQNLWRFAILLALLLLFGETWLANRTYR